MFHLIFLTWFWLVQFNKFLLLCCIIFGLFCIVYFIHQKWVSLIPEQKVKSWAKYLSAFLFFEFCLFLSAISWYIVSKSADITPFYNTTSLLNLKDFIFSSPGPNGATISFENLSGLISVVSILIIFLYFFHVFSNTKFFAERTAIQEKYAAVFWIPIVIVLVGGIFIIFLDEITHKPPYGDAFLLIFGIVNILLSSKIPIILRKYFFTNGVDFDTHQSVEKIFNYNFIDSYRRLPKSGFETFISDLILAFTLLLAFYSYISNCNIFMLILAEYCLLTIFFWIRQLSLIPTKRMTIELKETDTDGNHVPLVNLFIISDSSKGYFVVLDENSTLRQIMKDSIHQIIFQKD